MTTRTHPAPAPRCSICHSTDLLTQLRGGICRHCRQRAVNQQARMITFRVEGMTYRELKRAALELAVRVQQLDGDVAAAIRQDEEIDARYTGKLMGNQMKNVEEKEKGQQVA